MFNCFALTGIEAFQEILAEQKLDHNEEWVATGDFEEEGGYRACRKIMGAVRKPSAILCANDLMAIGAIRALEEMKLLVPENVSVVGFDDMEEAAYHKPLLTTIAFSPYEMGKLAAQKMFSLIAEEPLSEKATVLQGKLVERESTSRTYS